MEESTDLGKHCVAYDKKTHYSCKVFAKINLTKLTTGFAGFLFSFKINASYLSIHYLQYVTLGKNMQF